MRVAPATQSEAVLEAPLVLCCRQWWARAIKVSVQQDRQGRNLHHLYQLIGLSLT